MGKLSNTLSKLSLLLYTLVVFIPAILSLPPKFLNTTMLSQHRSTTLISRISSFIRSSAGTKWSFYGFLMMCITLIALFTFQEMPCRKRLLTLPGPELKKIIKQIKQIPHIPLFRSEAALKPYLGDMKQLSYTKLDSNNIKLTGIIYQRKLHEDVLSFSNANHVRSLIDYLKKKGVKSKDYP